MKYRDYIKIDPYSATPKYIQLTHAILSAIESGRLHQDELLPSINEISAELEISRDTAEKGYKNLKRLDVLGSVPGKGYYIKSAGFRQRFKILLLFNKLSVHKKILYDAFIGALDPETQVDFYIYNNDFKLFKKILAERKDIYTHYVIIPHFFEGENNIRELIEGIPRDQIILLDKRLSYMEPGEGYAAVYEHFEKDIYNALVRAISRLRNYQRIKLVFPRKSYYPKEIIGGFQRFCRKYAFEHVVIPSIKTEVLQAGEVYITVMEDDLVHLIERIKETALVTGKDIGVISYNETPIKKIILNGITTISTDFKKMGRLAAELITNNRQELVEVPFSLFLRDSL
ncbi:MAG TPA: GntR family transcriptional regulator [Arachidicoccus sp.]|nr:GntR family transcriptional regulator [Arachidicoccus sp.]